QAKKGETIATILRDNGATPEEIGAIAGLLGPYGFDGGIKEGQKLRILMSPMVDSPRLQPVRVIVADDTAIKAVVALADIGRYVAVDPRSIDNNVTELAEDANKNAPAAGITLYQSVYETALRNNVPRPIIDDLIRMYSFDVDFERKAQAGD